MAIYVGLQVESETEISKVYSFFMADGTIYGSILVNKETKEIELIDAVDEKAKTVAFSRARRALQKAITKDTLPDKLCFAS